MTELLICPHCDQRSAWIDEDNPSVLHCNLCGMEEEIEMEKREERICTDCKTNIAKPHYDNGLFCGNDMCDECFNKMVERCRQRSW
jgi:hypothetical protein